MERKAKKEHIPFSVVFQQAREKRPRLRSRSHEPWYRRDNEIIARHDEPQQKFAEVALGEHFSGGSDLYAPVF